MGMGCRNWKRLLVQVMARWVGLWHFFQDLVSASCGPDAASWTGDACHNVCRALQYVNLKTIAPPRVHPQYRTGCVIGCLRKMQKWCLPVVLEEYQRFPGAKARLTDMKFIENYGTSRLSQCLYRIIYLYVSHNRRSVYQEESVQQKRITSI